MTDTTAIILIIVLLTCAAVVDANFGGNGALFNGCVIGMFFGSLIESNVEPRPRP
jgi:hypothetical protein